MLRRMNHSPACLLALTIALAGGCRGKAPAPDGFQGLVEYDGRVVGFEVPGQSATWESQPLTASRELREFLDNFPLLTTNLGESIDQRSPSPIPLPTRANTQHTADTAPVTPCHGPAPIRGLPTPADDGGPDEAIRYEG